MNVQPRLAVSSVGVVVVGWPGNGARLSWSTDFGQTFAPSVDVSQGISGLDMDVAVDGRGRLHVIWRGFDSGIDDVYYTYSMGTLSGGGFPGIDPDRFAPMRNLTQDQDSQVYLSIAADAAGRAYLAFMSAIDPPFRSELMIVHGSRQSRFSLRPNDVGIQVEASPGGKAAFFFSRSDPSAVDPYVILCVRGEAFLFERPIPHSEVFSAPAQARSVAVEDDGMIAVAMVTGNKNVFDLFTELTVSRDFGQTFSEPLNVTKWTEPPQGLRGVLPSLTVDGAGTIHVVYQGPFLDAIDGYHILYVAARYE